MRTAVGDPGRLLGEAELLEHVRRRGVGGVGDRGHGFEAERAERNLDARAGGFRGIAAAPPRAPERIAELDLVADAVEPRVTDQGAARALRDGPEAEAVAALVPGVLGEHRLGAR